MVSTSYYGAIDHGFESGLLPNFFTNPFLLTQQAGSHNHVQRSMGLISHHNSSLASDKWKEESKSTEIEWIPTICSTVMKYVVQGREAVPPKF